MKRRVIAAVVIASGLLIGVSLYATRAGQDVRPPARQVAIESNTADLWPVSRSWVWTVDPVATRQQVGVCVRTVESAIPPGQSLALPVAPKLPPKGDDRHSGWSLVGDRRLTGRVTCQVIDFREAGLDEAVGDKPLRLLVRLRLGGSLIGITGKEAVLAGESFAGVSAVPPQWAGDELHLLTVYTRRADTLFAHHVLVQQRNGE